MQLNSIKKHLFMIIFFLILFLTIFNPLVGFVTASDCEIVDVQIFEREQPVIITDWLEGIPYMRYVVEVYSCADIKFRNTWWQVIYSTDTEVTATFDDQSTATKMIGCEKKRVEPNETFSCPVCFETDSPISKLDCRFR